jgi:electron transport complex protein RnfC
MKLLGPIVRLRGGVHTPHRKAATSGLPSREAPPVSRLVVSTLQHMGAPALPVVAVGDRVAGGQLIARPAEGLSAAVHAPIAGRVAALADAPTPQGRTAPAIVIERDGEDAWTGLPPVPEWEREESGTLLGRIAEAGIVGMGGAGFPTHVKLRPPPGRTVDTLILNGAECEAFLTSDARLMIERPREVWEGGRILRRILGARCLRLAVEENQPEAVRAMAAAMPAGDGDTGVVVLPARYPLGSERQQVRAVTGRTVPAGGLPVDVGCLVENVATAFAVREAVVEGRPLVRRYVTVSGDAVRSPANLLVPVGTAFSDLMAACDGLAGPLGKAIAGGPMMGFALPSLDVAADKTSSGLLLLSPRGLTSFESQACIACGRCVAACPMGLMPSEMSRDIEADALDADIVKAVANCYECGTCAYLCPARRPLVQHMRRAKAALQARRAAGGGKP